ncbi:hypothetical protein AF332_17455 [Sporosarcina globispora]|uniref:Uncharacterized protein n=1 Tax=Sporosarcina globispora TaxID=1459 RepID=A0A0M0GF62_SPOGL|nr:hypothetical protein [Sporosarcina globispora]KON88418.1 hypothetical protein AF332_17455 [Sporosarcina globispora]
MSIFENILDILEKKGSISIPSLLDEMNRMSHFKNTNGKQIELSHVKSVISRKKEIFHLKNDIITIDPDKEPILLSFSLGGYPGPWYKIEVDFINGRFVYFEWHLSSFSPRNELPQASGSIEDFKKELYRFKFWKWQNEYRNPGIIMDGVTWSVKLITKENIFESQGIQAFPKSWEKFCKAISKLTGKYIC